MFKLQQNETSATKIADTTLGTANNAGTITTNAVETFNITSTAVDVDGAPKMLLLLMVMLLQQSMFQEMQVLH